MKSYSYLSAAVLLSVVLTTGVQAADFFLQTISKVV